MFEVQAINRPYPGLRPFEPWESSIFFGRESHTDLLLEILDREHVLVVTGPSGSGKSSLIRAGLVPALPLGTIGRGVGWRVAMMKPGDRPVRRLAQALLEPEAFGVELLQRPEPGGENNEPLRSLAHVQAELTRGPRSLVDLVADVRAHSTNRDFDLLLLVDQFEEIFTYEKAGERDVNEADQFVNLLLQAAADKAAGIYVVMTMRTDFLGQCTRFLELPNVINHAGFLTPRLSRDELAKAVSGPARVFGGDLDADLTGELVNAGHDDPDQLPVLQHALARMWDLRTAAGDVHPRLTLQDLHAVGGIDAALSRHADEVLDGLSRADASGQVLLYVQWLFRCISERRSAEAGGQLVRRPTMLRSISDSSGIAWELFVPILQSFAQPQVSFLTYPGQPGAPEQGEETVVDISHEALLRQWGQLKTWVAAEVKAAERYRELQRRTSLQGGSLLTGPDLSFASEWFRAGLGFLGPEGSGNWSIPTMGWASRYPGEASYEDVVRYYRNSMDAALAQARHARRQVWLMRSIVGMVFVLGVTASFVGYNGYRIGVDRNAQALWHQLQFDGRSGAKDDEVVSGLLALARSDRSTREEAIRKWVDNEALARQFANSNHFVLYAALGIDEALRDELIRAAFLNDKEGRPDVLRARAQVVEGLGLLDRLDTMVRALSQTTEAMQLAQLSDGLVRLSKGLSAEADRRLLDMVVVAMGASTHPGQIAHLGKVVGALKTVPNDQQAQAMTAAFIVAMNKATEAPPSKGVVEGLRAMSGKLAAPQLPAFVNRMVQWLGKSPRADKIQLVVGGFCPVHERLQAAQAFAATQALFEALSAIDMNVSGFADEPVAECFAGLVRRLDREQNQIMLARLLGLKVELILRPWNTSLSTAIAAAIGNLDSDQAGALAPTLAERMIETRWPSNEESRRLAIKAVLPKLQEAQIQGLIERFMTALHEQSDTDQRLSHGSTLAVLTKSLKTAEARRAVAMQLWPALMSAPTYGKTVSIGVALAPVADQLSETQAQGVATRLIDVAYKEFGTADDTRVFMIGFGLSLWQEAFASVGGKLSPTQSLRVAGRMVEIMSGSHGSVAGRDMVAGLAQVSARLDDERALALISYLVDAINKAGKDDPLELIGEGLATLVRQIDATSPLARKLNDALIAAMKRVNSVDKLKALSRGLGALALDMSDADVAASYHRLIAMVGSTTPDESENAFLRFYQGAPQSQVAVSALGALASRLSPRQAVQVMDLGINGVLGASSKQQLSPMKDVMQACAARLSGEQAQVQAMKLLELVGKTRDDDHLSALSAGLQALLGRLADGGSKVVLGRIIDAFGASNLSVEQMDVLTDAFVKLLPRQAPAQLKILGDRLLDAVNRPASGMAILRLTSLLSSASPVLLKDVKDVARWVELCKSPFADRELIVAAIRKLDTKGPPVEAGTFAYLAWAAKKYGVDVSTPLHAPKETP